MGDIQGAERRRVTMTVESSSHRTRPRVTILIQIRGMAVYCGNTLPDPRLLASNSVLDIHEVAVVSQASKALSLSIHLEMRPQSCQAMP